MHDEIDGRFWADHGDQFSKDVHKLVKRIMRAFEVLARIEYAEPWAPRKAKRRTTAHG